MQIILIKKECKAPKKKKKCLLQFSEPGEFHKNRQQAQKAACHGHSNRKKMSLANVVLHIL